MADHPSKIIIDKVEDEPFGRRPSRVELMAALRKRGVQYAPNAGGAELAALLLASKPQPVAIDSNGAVLNVLEDEPSKMDADGDGEAGGSKAPKPSDELNYLRSAYTEKM